jgi:hypothetical protein
MERDGESRNGFGQRQDFLGFSLLIPARFEGL